MVQTLWPVAQALVQPGFQSKPQGQMQPMAEWTEQNDLPVTQLIARCFHNQTAVRRHATCGQNLPADMPAKIACRVANPAKGRHCGCKGCAAGICSRLPASTLIFQLSPKPFASACTTTWMCLAFANFWKEFVRVNSKWSLAGRRRLLHSRRRSFSPSPWLTCTNTTASKKKPMIRWS